MARYLSCPAARMSERFPVDREKLYSPVSQICDLMRLPSTSMLLVANSTPIVLLLSTLNSPRVNRDSTVSVS